MSKNFFFSHDFSARNDEKILILRSKFDLEGYGAWWCIVETLAEHDGKIKESSLVGVAFNIQMPWDQFKTLIDECIDLELLHLEDGFLLSKSLNERLEHKREVSRRRTEAGKRSAEARKKANAEQVLNKCSTNAEQSANKNEQTKPKPKPKPKQNQDIINIEGKPSNSIEIREKEFASELASYVDEYGKDRVRAFFEYWTEPNKSKTKMRFESEKTWDTGRRIKRWKSNKFGGANQRETVTQGISRMIEETKQQLDNPLQLSESTMKWDEENETWIR